MAGPGPQPSERVAVARLYQPLACLQSKRPTREQQEMGQTGVRATSTTGKRDDKQGRSLRGVNVHPKEVIWSRSWLQSAPTFREFQLWVEQHGRICASAALSVPLC